MPREAKLPNSGLRCAGHQSIDPLQFYFIFILSFYSQFIIFCRVTRDAGFGNTTYFNVILLHGIPQGDLHALSRGGEQSGRK